MLLDKLFCEHTACVGSEFLVLVGFILVCVITTLDDCSLGTSRTREHDGENELDGRNSEDNIRAGKRHEHYCGVQTVSGRCCSISSFVNILLV